MTILVKNRFMLDQDIVDLINLFMSEASGKINTRRGLSKHQNPETYDKAVGLVEVMVPFEALITMLKPNEPRVWKKREFFSSSYQDFFVTFKDSCKVWINALSKELENESLLDMTPPPKTREPINIDNKNNLNQIIEVIYRVRSNMVHGKKTLNSQRNKILIVNSFHLIYNILDHILREEEILR